MSNTSAKRIANQNESVVRTLKLGMILPTMISLIFRFLLRRDSLPPSKASAAIYIVTFLPAFFLSNHLIKSGTPVRDPITNTLISYGEDLNQAGVTEWCFDIIYVTWACQVGSGILGDWFWWLYMVIPLYAVGKLWTSLLSPMLFGSSGAPSDAVPEKETLSKRQEKLRKRSERGDPRVKAQPSRR